MKIDKFVIILVCWMMLIPPASSQSSPFQSGKLLIQLNQNHPIAHNPDNSDFLNLFQSEVSGFASIQKEFKINQVERSIKLENRENINLKNFYTLSFDTLANLDSIISRFRQLEMVETIDKIGFFQVDFTPNDSLYSQGLQWYLHRIEADSVWNFTLGNPHIKIAVVDDAILIRHKDLQSTISVNQAELNTIFSDSNSNGIIDVPDLLMHYNCFDISELWLTGLFDGLDNDGNGYIDDLFGWDFNLQTNDPNPSLFPYLENDHGTAVAGLISATTNNSLGIASLGSGCSILPLKVFGTYGPSSLHILEAMSYAYDQYADIINISMTGTSNSALDSLVVALYEDEVFLVASAGNSNSTLLGFPAANPLSIVVAALDSFDLKHPTSNYGTSIDLCAPGISMTTLAKSGDDLFAYRHDFGATSGAAPLVSGLLGLMKSFYPDFAYSALYSCLLSSTDSLTADSYFLQQQLGAGRINARKAMECLKNQALVADFYLADTTLCAGETIQLSDLSEGNIASWKWYSDNGATFDADTAQHPLITFHSLVDSIYTISLEISNINLLGPNYVSTLTKQVHVQPDLLNLGNDMVGLCSTVPYTLSISLPEVFSYFWSTGETTSTIQACQSGSYSVEIIQNGCAFKDTIQLSMDNPLLINLEDTLLLCNGDGAWLDAGALSVPVIWSPGGDTTAIIWIQNPGLYSITAVNGCGNFYDSIMVEAHVNNFEFQNDSIPVETNHSIAIDVGDGWQTILWSTGDCTPIIQVFTPGTYWVQVIDDYGCDAGDTLVVYQVNDNPAINLSHILCYPNPTVGELLIEGLSGQVTIEVYDYLGKRLISLSSNETKQYINLNSYPIGIYYLLIQTSSQKRESWKVVKI